MNAGTVKQEHRLHAVVFRMGVVLLFLVSVPAVTRLPAMTSLNGPDASWREAYVYFLKTDAQAGVDYTFTYGPLGHFLYPVYDPDLYTLDVAIAVLLAVLTVVPLVWTAVRCQRLAVAFCLGWIAVGLVPWSVGVEAGYSVAIVLMVLLLLERPGRPPWIYALTGIAFGFLSLTKFPLFILCAVGTAVVVMLRLLQQPIRGERVPGAFVLAICFPVSLLLFWILAGQHPANLVPYVINCLALSQSYTLGMHVPVSETELWLAGGILLLLALQLTRLLTGGRHASRENMAVALFMVVVLLLVWKMGVVRSQMPKFFIPAAALSVFLGTVPLSPHRWWSIRRGLVFPVVALATIGTLQGGAVPLHTHAWEATSRVLVQAADMITFRSREPMYRLSYDTSRRLAALPMIRRIVGSSTVDVFSANQSIALFNDLNYTPRPVFQGYAACSPRLIERNRAFYDGPDAPDYVLYLAIATAIDGRYPTTEDPEALKALFRNYRPLLEEHHFLLLERLPPDQRLARDDVPVRDRHAGVAPLEDWVELNDMGANWQLLALHLSPTMAGYLRSLVFQPPIPWLEVRQADGELRRGRINIGAIEHGFIINPAFDHATSVDNWPVGAVASRITAFRITTAPGNDGLLADTFEYDVTTVPPLPSARNSENTEEIARVDVGLKSTDGIE